MLVIIAMRESDLHTNLKHPHKMLATQLKTSLKWLYIGEILLILTKPFLT